MSKAQESQQCRLPEDPVWFRRCVWVLRVFILVGGLLIVGNSVVKHPLVTSSLGAWAVVMGVSCLVWSRTGVDYTTWYNARRLDEGSRKEWLDRAGSGRLRRVYSFLILFTAIMWIIGGCVFAVLGLQQM